MKITTKVLDWIAAWMGVFDVDWEAGLEDDGYSDPFGRAALGESYESPAEQPRIRVVSSGSGRNIKRA